MINKFRRRIQGVVKIRIESWSLIKSSREQTKAQKIGPISIKVKDQLDDLWEIRKEGHVMLKF